jgi:hypothetical protein
VTAGLGPYPFVFRYALARRGSFTLRIITPLHLSQATHSTINRSEQRWTQFLPAMREAPVSHSTIFRSAHKVRQVAFVRLESNRLERRIERKTVHHLPGETRPDIALPASAPFLAHLANSKATFHQHLIQPTAFRYFSAEHRTLVLRAKEGPLLATTRHFPFLLPGRNRFEAHSLERVVTSTAALGHIFVPQPQVSASGSTQQFFDSMSTTSLTFRIHMAPFALMNASAATASPISGSQGPATMAYSPVSQSLAIGLPNTRAARELQLTTRMVLSTRPEQVLAAGSTTYVFAQQPRPASAESPRSFASDQQEVVDLVQSEVKKAMSPGAIVANFCRHDFVSITDQVESLLKRRLLAEKERLGLSPN